MKPIEIIRTPTTPENVREHAALHGDMVKLVADVERGILALGGEMHADAEQVLLEDGSRSEDLWGANVYPERPRDERIEYTSLINVRPRQGNRTMELHDEVLQVKIRSIIDTLLP